MNFKDKVCVITGGAKGIGKCIALEFAKRGAKIAFIDSDEKAGLETLSECLEHSDSTFINGDIAIEDDLTNYANETIKRFSKVDYLINNACLSKKGILSGCGFDDFNYVLKVGITAPYMLSKLFLPYFNENATIVNIASTRAFMSQADTESYSAAKGGIVALTHALAVSLAHKVRVNSISPGWIDTGAYHDKNYVPNHKKEDFEQHLSGRIGEPEDIARVAMFLCDENNGFITGQNITVDGGMTKLMIYTGDDGWELKKD